MVQQLQQLRSIQHPLFRCGICFVSYTKHLLSQLWNTFDSIQKYLNIYSTEITFLSYTKDAWTAWTIK